MNPDERSPLPSPDLPGASAPIFRVLQERRAGDARPGALRVRELGGRVVAEAWLGF